MARVRTIVVDSRQRNLSAHPRANDYVVRLSEELRGVESLELVYALYPTFGTESYVNLFVDEVEDRGSVVTMDSSEVCGAFTQLPLLAPLNEYTPARHYRSRTSFRTPLARLSRLTLRFTDAFGAPYPVKDHMLRFEAVCGERQRQRESDLVQRLAASDPLLPPPVVDRDPPAERRSLQIPAAAAPRKGHGGGVPRPGTPAETRALHRLSRSLSELACGDRRRRA